MIDALIDKDKNFVGANKEFCGEIMEGFNGCLIKAN